MPKALTSWLVGGSLALALSACGGTGPVPPNTLSGTLTAPPGGDVSNTAVLACYTEGCDPSDGYSRSAVVTQAGASAPYLITDVKPGSYTVLAIKDANGNGSFEAGDYLGVYSADGQNLTPVTVPAGGIDIQLGVAQAQ